MRSRRSRSVAVAISVGAVLLSTLAGTAAANAADTGRHSLGGAPSWATPGHKQGDLPGGQRIPFRVVVNNSHQPSIDALITDVTDPKSKDYGKYLTPAQYDARYAPSAADVKSVESFLTSQGIQVTAVGQGNKWIDASGTAAQVGKAFDTSMANYSHDGKRQYAPSSALSVPASVAGVVGGVTGLAQGETARKPGGASPEPTAPGAAAPTATKPPASQCSDYWGEYQQTLPEAFGQTKFNTYLCGETPAQLRKLYGTTGAVATGDTGKGVTVAILDAYASPTMLSDANQTSTALGDRPFAPGQYSEKIMGSFVNQDECAGEAGWNGEEAIDVEAVHGMAPGAHVLYVGATDCDTGLDDAANWVVETHAASIVSNSYSWGGEPTDATDQAEIKLEHAIMEQAAAEGIGFYFATGDDGDTVIDGQSPQPEYQASDPYVTGVGATSEIIGKNDQLVARTGWETLFDRVDYSGATPVYEDGPVPGDYFYGGSGGGTSQLFTQPWYQTSTVPNSLSQARGATKMRTVPDIAADGDPYTGMYRGFTDGGTGGTFSITTWGGTSLATPLVAGIQALAQQNRPIAIGFANPLLYEVGARGISDVTPHPGIHFASTAGSYLGTFDAGDTQKTTYGYDDETGLGVPNGSFIGAEFAAAVKKR
ncbi:S53 family peptidase [Gryllotalpicola koreensis]|uniref:S53 family peptidase n=1 Tax=Gryllotalpicola koreensis TaxID=993086 RepID=A0ABP8A6K1_9MICO